MMDITTARRKSALAGLTVLLALGLAALACSPSSGPAVTSAPLTTKSPNSTETSAATDNGTPGAEPATTESATAGGGSTAGEINASNAKNLVELQTITVSSQPVLAGAVSGKDHTVATLGVDRTVRTWDGDTGKKLKEMPKHADLGFGLAFSKDGSILASGAGYNVTLWDPSTGKKEKSLTPNGQVYRMAFSPDGKTLAVAGEGRSKLDLIDVAGGRVEGQVASPQGFVLWSVAFSPDGKMLAAADNQGNLTVFEADSKSQLGSASAKGAAWDVEFSPDSKYVTTCNATSDIGGISTWDTSKFQPYDKLTMPEVHPKGCLDGVYDHSGDVFFSVGADDVLNAWEVSSGNLLFSKTFGSAPWTVSISGDGQILAVTLDDGTLHILGLKS